MTTVTNRLQILKTFGSFVTGTSISGIMYSERNTFVTFSADSCYNSQLLRHLTLFCVMFDHPSRQKFFTGRKSCVDDFLFQIFQELDNSFEVFPYPLHFCSSPLKSSVLGAKMISQTSLNDFPFQIFWGWFFCSKYFRIEVSLFSVNSHIALFEHNH